MQRCWACLRLNQATKCDKLEKLLHSYSSQAMSYQIDIFVEGTHLWWEREVCRHCQQLLEDQILKSQPKIAVHQEKAIHRSDKSIVWCELPKALLAYFDYRSHLKNGDVSAHHNFNTKNKQKHLIETEVMISITWYGCTCNQEEFVLTQFKLAFKSNKKVWNVLSSWLLSLEFK